MGKCKRCSFPGFDPPDCFYPDNQEFNYRKGGFYELQKACKAHFAADRKGV